MLKHSSYFPQPSQEKALKNLISRLGQSELARGLAFHKVKNPDDMRTLPQTDYTSIKPYLENLSPDCGRFGKSRIVSIASTSGSTGEPKKIPITKDYVSSYRSFVAGIHASLLETVTNVPAGGKSLLLTARPLTGISDGNIPEGFISGFMAAQAPFWERPFLLPSKKILFMDSWEQKMDAILEEAEEENVTTIVGVPALILSFTERALKKYKVADLRQHWPNLRGLLHSGTDLPPAQRKLIAKMWGETDDNPLIFWEMYTCTEAQIGHTYHPYWPGMIFNASSNFYQFFDQENKIYHLHELKSGQRYGILVTTPGGLINYRLGDWVEILSTKPLTFRVAGRDSDEISIATEKISTSQVRQAVTRVSETFKTNITDYAFWPRVGQPNQLICTLSMELRLDLSRAEKILDDTLAEINPSYREMRMNDLIYGPLRIVPIPDDSFRLYRLKNLDRGQFKQKLLFKSEEQFRENFSIP